jgi:hypothetical protein
MTWRGRDGFIETEEVVCQCGDSMDFGPQYQGQSPPGCGQMNWTYSGDTSYSTASRPGISMTSFFLREPRIASSLPS